jgi:RHS repeat-associated protein
MFYALTVLALPFCARAQEGPPNYLFTVQTDLGGGYYPWGESIIPKVPELVTSGGQWSHTYKSAAGYGTNVTTSGSSTNNSITLTEQARLSDEAGAGSYLYEAVAKQSLGIWIREDLRSSIDGRSVFLHIRLRHDRSESASAGGTTAAKAWVNYGRNSAKVETPGSSSDSGSEEFYVQTTGLWVWNCKELQGATRYCLMDVIDLSAAVGGYDDRGNAGGIMSAASTLTSTFFVAHSYEEEKLVDPEETEGDEDEEPEECLRKGLTNNVIRGNISVNVLDPVKTRGYPLKNDIKLNTHNATKGAMGNLAFSYGIHVTEERVPSYFINGGERVVKFSSKYRVVDGDGSTIKFGLTADNKGKRTDPTPPAGIGSQLLLTATGYELMNAGQPGMIEKFGHFKYTFDAKGRLTTVTDPAGNKQQLTYEGDRLTRIDDTSSQRSLTLAHTAEGLISTVVQNGGPRTEIGYTASGKATTIRSISKENITDHEVAFTYNSEDKLATITFDNDATQRYTITYKARPGMFDARVPLMAREPIYDAVLAGPGVDPVTYSYEKSTTGSGLGLVITESVNAKGARTRYIVSRGEGILGKFTKVKTTMTLANSNYPQIEETKTVDRGDITSTRSYSYNNGVIKSWRKQEDVKGRRVKFMQSGRTMTYKYDDQHLLDIKDEKGALASYEYGALNLPHHPTSIIDGLGQKWSVTYNEYGQPVRIIPPSGSVKPEVLLSYYEDKSSPYYGYLFRVQAGTGGRIVEYQDYDVQGNVLKWFDGTETRQRYDSLHRVVETGHTDGSKATAVYKGTHMIKSVDELNRATTYEWCTGCGGLKSLLAPLDYGLNWERNKDFDITAFKDSNKKDTRYRYDSFSDLLEVIYPDETYERYTQKSYKPRGYQKAEDKKDGRNLPVSRYYNELTGLVGKLTWDADEVTYVYSPRQLLEKVTQISLGKKTYTYDILDRISTVVIDYSTAAQNALVPLQTILFTYSSDNAIKTLEWKSGETTVGVWNYQYNDQGLLASVENVRGETTLFSYDAHHRVQEQNNTVNNTVTHYEYSSERGWLTRLVHARYTETTETPFADLRYERDAVGNIKKITDAIKKVVVPKATSGTSCPKQVQAVVSALQRVIVQLMKRPQLYTGFAVQILQKIIAEAQKQCTVVPATQEEPYTVNYQYDDLNRLTQETGNDKISSSFGYDAMGNIITKDGASFGTYDAASKLVTVGDRSIEHDAAGNMLSVPEPTGMRLSFDARNKLVKVIKDGGSEITYGYDEEGLLVWRQKDGVRRYLIRLGLMVLGEVEASGAVAVVHTAAEGNLLSSAANGKSTTYHFGHIGQTLFTTESTSGVPVRYDYSPYGERRDGGGELAYGYVGQAWCRSEVESGLVNCGQRWFSPKLERWVSRDPIGYGGGVNLYGYVENNPQASSDPKGETPYFCTSQIVIRENWLPPDIEIFNHHYLCVNDICYGYTKVSGKTFLPPVLSLGKVLPEVYNPTRCRPVSSHYNEQCIESCMLQEFTTPAPESYGVGPQGTDCQEWASDVLSRCFSKCRYTGEGIVPPVRGPDPSLR